MNKRIIIMSVIGVLLLVVIPNSVSSRVRSTTKDALSPVISALYHGSSAIRKVAIVATNIKTLPTENDQLSAEVTRLLVENSNIKEVEHENALLKSELNYSGATTKRKLIGSRIIARSAFVFQDIVTIDKGQSDGVKVNQPVTSSGALIGKIISTGDKTADVELITSSSAVTQVQLQNSRTTAILKGGIRGLMLEYIPLDVVIAPGEGVITSGLGGDLRPGLIIGTVDRIVSQKNEVFQRISVKPAANISRADLVFIEINE